MAQGLSAQTGGGVVSRWFIKHRLQFIADNLRVYGQITRAVLVDRFDISLQQASADISLFVKEHPDAMIHDGRAKTYVVNETVLPEDAPE